MTTRNRFPRTAATLVAAVTRAGKLEFDCNVRGHYEAGMAGTITVMPAPPHRAGGTP